MAKNDFFMRVALEHHPVGKDELVESEPIKYDKKLFKPSTSACNKITEKSYNEKLIEFNEELGKLRERYKPFMLDFTPEADMKRKFVELKDFKFRYECEEDKNDIGYVLDGSGEWEKVAVPDYRGPVGKWTGYYRTDFRYKRPSSDRKVFLRFLGADYIANVYLNNRYIGSHEGFFAPFEFDVTEILQHDAENVLVVEIKNDIPTVGLDGENVNGDKIYAATGLGWDDPKEGWHHCPPGAGIYNKVILEERRGVFIDSVFVRTDIDNSSVEIRTQINNSFNINKDIKLSFSLFPFNFKADGTDDIVVEDIESAGLGINYYRFTCKLPDYRLWKPNEPWLYKARVTLKYSGETLADQKDSVFGMRKFHMDENSEEKGTLYLNNEPVILRGANDMGHMQQCVLKGDFEQLVDDILIAKLANMNYFRFTQRPVQEEIYHYCDMLGMMNQTDLPLFGYLRRNQFCEALRQVGEMERLVRNYPSSIMVSYINEPFSVGTNKMGHRHLYRDELEAFFEAADRVVKVENPDRVIKHVEGDYDPPTTTGLSDFHCYNMWYTNHALPIGKLYKGWLPQTQKGWKTGCGEYGTEGLDNYDVMIKYYPKDWLPLNEGEEWTPDRIVKAQSNSMHGDWYEEQHNIMDWIRESQKHQALATTLMSDAFRRRSDKMVSTAIHLLIDAWPAGWMKALVGVNRIPKPSYFAFRKSFERVRVNLRYDRWKVYESDDVEIEALILNDTQYEFKGCRIIATVRDDEKEYGSYEICCDAKAVTPTYAGSIRFRVPKVKERKMLYIDAVLMDKNDEALNLERFCMEAFERRREDMQITVAYLGGKAYKLAFELGVKAVEYDECSGNFNTLIVSDCEKYELNKNDIMEFAEKGAQIVFITPERGKGEWEFAGNLFKYRNIFGDGYIEGINDNEGNGLSFVSRNDKNKKTGEFRPDDFSYWYNSDKDMIDSTAVHYMDSDELVPLLFTYRKPSFFDKVNGAKQRLLVAGEIEYGEGKAIFLSICLEGRVGYNPVLDRFIGNVIFMK